MRTVKHIALGFLAFVLGLGVCRVLGIFWRLLFTALDPARPPKVHIIADILLGFACTAMVLLIGAMVTWGAKSVGEEIEFRYHNWKNK